MRTIYALLVGIDRYAGDVATLAGCENDVRAVEELLPTVLDDEVAIQSRLLLNEQATRDAVARGFREHLAAAKPGDVALFWDLTDKELAALVGEVSSRGVQVLVVLDSCHSGSGVRAVEDGDGVRWAPLDPRERPAHSYLERAPSGVRRAGWEMGDRPGYVLLAACASHQTAKETTVDGNARGAFSAALLDAIADTGGRMSYADLVAWTASRIARRVRAQDPQLECTDPADAGRAFLADSREGRAGTARQPAGRWRRAVLRHSGAPAAPRTGSR